MNIQSSDESSLLRLVHNGVLRVDADGSVWRCMTLTRVGRWRSITPRRADELRKDGYRGVRIQVKGDVFFAMAHRLVWLALRGPIADGLEINHKDGKRGRNDPNNLEPLTPGANQEHAYRELQHARMSGARNGRAVLDSVAVAEIRSRLVAGETHRSIAKRFNVTHRSIGKIARGESWLQ